MFPYRVFAFALLVLLGACTTTGIHGRPDLTYDDHPSGWALEIRQAAERAYPYAQMSTNAYDDDGERFDLGPRIATIANVPNDSKGFAYSLFRRHDEAGVPREIVIAFRGTEFTHLNDWIHGNLLDTQNRRGLRLFERLDNEGLPVTLTGHSLGGGIATHVSLNAGPADAYVFNSSPRFRSNGRPRPNRRLSIVEFGEVLKLPRMFSPEPTQTYISINCTRGPDFIKGHKMRRLAACLTRIAAWGDMEARRSLERNNLAFPAGLRLEDPLRP